MKVLTVPAKPEELDSVLEFVNQELEACGCSLKTQMQTDIAVEEIFINIASYAYHPETGSAEIRCEAGQEDGRCVVSIQFLDGGKPYNPLEKEDPDTSLGAEERNVGGLGIYMVKKSMDGVEYEYKAGKNVLTIRKVL